MGHPKVWATVVSPVLQARGSHFLGKSGWRLELLPGTREEAWEGSKEEG